jgi:ribosome-binding factor A
MATHPNRAKDALRALAAQIHDDDRPPTRKETSRPPFADRKSLALAGQIRKTLELALRLGVADPSLSGVVVDDVTLTPEGVAKVLITVPSSANPSHVLTRLAAATPHLRAEVARVITRKRVPQLAFALAAPRTDQEAR